jgi:hypothetical protein
MLLPADITVPEKRKAGGSIPPLTTSFGLVLSTLTSANADLALSCPQPSSDHDRPCVTVVGRSLSHVDRTSRLRASGLRPLRPELAVALSVCPSSQLAQRATGRARWRLYGDVAVRVRCTVRRISSSGAVVRIGSGWTNVPDWSSLDDAARR